MSRRYQNGDRLVDNVPKNLETKLRDVAFGLGNGIGNVERGESLLTEFAVTDTLLESSRLIFVRHHFKQEDCLHRIAV